MRETHLLRIHGCCPISSNPRPGSTLTIAYTPAEHLLEVVALKAYIDSYQGGRGEVRSMEGMVQAIAADCAAATGVAVMVTAQLLLHPSQEMKVVCHHG